MPTLMDFLKGINPAYAGALPGDYLSQTNAIQQALANKLFGLDLQEQDIQQGFELDKPLADRMREQGIRGFQDAAANRGTLRSGMTVRGLSDVNFNADTVLNNLIRNRNSAMTNIIGQRLQGQSDAAGALADIQSRIANQGMQAVVADAQEKANQRTAQAQGAYSDAQFAQNKALVDAQIKAYQGQQTTQMPPGMNIQAPSWYTNPSAPQASPQPTMAPKPTLSQPNVKPAVPTTTNKSNVVASKPTTAGNRYVRAV